MRSRILQLFFAGVSTVAFCAATMGVFAQPTPNRSLLRFPNATTRSPSSIRTRCRSSHALRSARIRTR